MNVEPAKEKKILFLYVAGVLQLPLLVAATFIGAYLLKSVTVSKVIYFLPHWRVIYSYIHLLFLSPEAQCLGRCWCVNLWNKNPAYHDENKVRLNYFE